MGEQTSTGAPRLPPLRVEDMRQEWVGILERIPGAGLKGANFPKNVLGALMHNPDIFGPFMEYWVTSKLKMGFSIREQELIILRMGFLYGCDYVWKHHVPVACEFGVSGAEIEALKTAPLPLSFSAREYALLRLVEELVDHRTIRQEAWAQWSGLLRQSELIDLIHIVSQYVLFALVNNALQVELEAPLRDIPGL
jgi:alkylhydroperoxidase family enzyme